MREISVDRILVELRESNLSSFRYLGWGMHATDAELELVLDSVESLTESAQLICLLRIFSRRALPRMDSRITDLCVYPDRDVQRTAYRALANNSHPTIRQFAIDQIREGEPYAIPLLRKNYAPGDERAILNSINLTGNLNETHWTLSDIIKVLEDNPSAEGLQLGIIAYASTPCGICRSAAAKLLIEQGTAPQWLVEECRFDSGNDNSKDDT